MAADDIRAMSEALAAEPASLVFLPLGEALLARGEYSHAQRVAQRGATRHPARVDAHDLVARIALAQGDEGRAMEAWRRVLALAPRFGTAHRGLGFLHYRQGDLARALEHLEADGVVAAGHYATADGTDLGAVIGAHLSGVSDEAQRAMRHFGLGSWTRIVIESEAAVVAMAPVGTPVVLVAAPRDVPLGFVRRTLDRCVATARGWLGALGGAA
jgi:predicted regulator of Ras-like GTPase activity (Roadblock/LC7/MglB family)